MPILSNPLSFQLEIILHHQMGYKDTETLALQLPIRVLDSVQEDLEQAGPKSPQHQQTGDTVIHMRSRNVASSTLPNPTRLVLYINLGLAISFLSINFLGLYIQIVLSRKGIF